MTAFFRDFKAEFKRVIWPNKEELKTQTITVIGVSLVVAAIVFLMDTAYTAILQLLSQLIG